MLKSKRLYLYEECGAERYATIRELTNIFNNLCEKFHIDMDINLKIFIYY